VSLVLKSQVTLRNTLSEKKATIPPVLNEAGGNFDRYTSDGYVVYNKPNTDLVGKGCGDGVCDSGENRNNCPADCKCGNGICEAQYGETINTCSRDCKCGNGICEAQYNETYATCSADCHCGNGICEDWESLNDCFADCHCGDFLCNANETYSTCQGDCKCGNGACEPALGESCSNCSADCGTCPPVTQPPCFLAGTPILMADGKTLPIEQIKVGDKITSYDEAGKKFVKDKVKKVLRHTAEEYLIINGHLKVTPNHSFYSEGKWQHIGLLKVGDNLFTSEGKIEKIREIKKIKAKIEVYNFEVNPYKTYIAGGYVVHNAYKTLPPIQ
ncbi:MAG: polymorphic toxin-type HINT domain-containing protein, partial [Candidatus Omnitrophota bacterium]|nr:polymorphic toxin-type HINT domain-containing protein [Candidatus Omnitrophota bacterium]